MTVIRPSSISGINSITANGGDINLFRADGTKADVPIINNITAGVVTATKFVGPIEGNLSNGTINATSGTITGNLGVGGVLTYEDVTNIDSIGIITARAGINVSGGTITGDGSGLTGVGIGTDGSVNTSGIVTATAFVSDTPLSHRNIIVNGGCLVAQRGTSSTAIADVGAYGSVDRFQMVGANLDQLAMLQKQTSDGPDGFSKCFEFDVTTPENALDANDLVYMRYLVEGQDLEPFFNANGTGKNFTLSFYVKAYQAGTYQLNIYKADGPRFITKTYTIASSGVWQRVVLNFTGDTNTSGMVQTTGSGFNIAWIFAAGTNYTSGSQSTNWGGWPGNAGFAAGHAVNSASSANNYFRITGVQLELGDVATPFEHRRFGDELNRCQRYYQQFVGISDQAALGFGRSNGSSTAECNVPLSVPLRASPTLNSCNWAVFTATNQSNVNSTTPSVRKWDAHSNMLAIGIGGLSGMTNARSLTVYLNSGHTFSMDAEL